MFTKHMIVYPVNKEKILLINTLSGAMDYIGAEEYKEMLNGSKNHLTSKLTDRYYLVENTEKDLENFEKLKKYSPNYIDKYSHRVSLVFCITYGCNLRCTYCFQGHGYHMDERIMTKEQVNDSLLSLAKFMQQHNKHDFSVSVFGGEPLQESTYTIMDYIFHLKQLEDKSISIITNGITIEPFKRLFGSFKNRISFQITLDGIKSVHDKRRIFPDGSGSYDCISNTLEYLIKEGFKITLRINVSVDSAKQLGDFFLQKDVSNWVSHPNFEIVIAPVTHNSCIMSIQEESEYDIYKNILKYFPHIFEYISKHKIKFAHNMFRYTEYLNNFFEHSNILSPVTNYCEATYLGLFAVCTDNYIYPCTSAIGNPHYAIGSLNSGFNEEWISEIYRHNIFNATRCSQCNVSTLCGGGCILALSKGAASELSVCNRCKKTARSFLQDHINKPS